MDRKYTFIGHIRRRTVARPGDEQDTGAACQNQTVEMRIGQIDTGRGTPMAQQSGLDVLRF